MITVRQGTLQDAEKIAQFSRDTFYAAFAAANSPENMDKFMTMQFSAKMLESQVGEPGNYFFLAEEGNALRGYVRLVESRMPEQLSTRKGIEIARIYAAPDYVGKGVGKLLMKASVDFARNLGKELLWLGVWEHNQRAIDFYRKWGFDQIGTHLFMLGDEAQTDWLMKKEISAD